MSDQNHTTSIEYREISRFPGYRFGSDGTAWTQWTAKRNRQHRTDWTRCSTWKLLKTANVNGYHYVRLSHFGRSLLPLHRFILEAFAGPCPEGMECRHLDGTRDNNHPNNLAWGTHQRNMDDCRKHGRTLYGTKNPHAKLSEEQARKIIQLINSGMTYKEIADRVGTTRSTVTDIACGNSWGYLTGNTRKRTIA